MDHSYKSQKKLTPNQAKLRAESYCAYQERSQQEVRDKLYQWGLYSQEVELTISQLIEDNFLNEERFAEAYARGKFKMNGWGKFKIRQGLMAKSVSSPLIKSALDSISDDDYYAKLEDIILKKKTRTREEDPFKMKQKLVRFAISRGFESELIWEIVNAVIEQ